MKTIFQTWSNFYHNFWTVSFIWYIVPSKKDGWKIPLLLRKDSAWNFYILLITLCNWKFWLESDGLYSIIQHSVLQPCCAALIISHVFSHRKENWNFPLMYSWSMKFGDQCSPYILCIKEKVLIKFISQQQDNTDIKNRLWFQYKS